MACKCPLPELRQLPSGRLVCGMCGLPVELTEQIPQERP